MRSAFVRVLPVLSILEASACASIPELNFGTAEDAGVVDAGADDVGAIDTSIPDTSLADTSIADVGVDTSVPLVPPGITSVTPAGTTADRVGMGDAALAPDGAADGIFDVTLVGPLTALVLLVTDGNGTSNKVDEWDTLVGTDPIPSTIGANYTQGAQTWVLGVFDGTARFSSADGRFALAAGTRSLTIAAADGGRFKPGAHFVLAARLGDNVTWVKSKVVLWK